MEIEAQEQERLRKKRVKALLRASNLIPPEDRDLILDLEANPGPQPRFEPEPGLEVGLSSSPSLDLSQALSLSSNLGLSSSRGASLHGSSSMRSSMRGMGWEMGG